MHLSLLTRLISPPFLHKPGCSIGRSSWRLSLLSTALLGIATIVVYPPVSLAQQPEAAAAPADADQGATMLDAEALKVLVAPIALYPDDVLAVVLPASTTGLQVVQAQRYLDKHKTDASLKPNADWDPSILALLNYPDVLARLNADLDWTGRLGDAVIDQQGDVMSAIQQIRNEAVAAGYLKSDAKTVVTQDQQTVVIQSADPQVIYVPNYDPQVIVEQTYVTAPPPAYYNPYPPYYSPAATFFTGMFVGGAIAYAFDWHHDDINVHGGDININNNNNINNINRNDLKKYNIDNKPGQNGNNMTWHGNQKRPGNRAPAATRPAGLAPANGFGKPATKPLAGQTLNGQTRNNQTLNGQKLSGQTKTGTLNNGQAKDRLGNKQATGKQGGFGGVVPGQQSLKQSQRGNQSLQNSQVRQPAKSPARSNNAGAFGNSRGGGNVGAQQQRGGASRNTQRKRR